MALPGNWNSSTIDVDPWVLHASAANMITAAQAILDDLGVIITALNNLKISWVGDSSDAATAATDRWNATMAQLFGTQQDPSSGILNILTGGLAYDAVNYSQCEKQVRDMFAQFESALTASSDQTSSGQTPAAAVAALADSLLAAVAPQQNVTDAPYPISSTHYYHTTSVNENF
jgi:uncharacterized protein YukE